MGTTLTGTTPQDTYDSLIKVTDNGPLSGTAKYLSDGLGNDSTLALSTSAVGIGTNTPDSNLVVNGSGSVRVNLRASNVRYGTIYADNGIVALSSITAIPLVLATDDAERMRITAAGNVGIGRTPFEAGGFRSLDVDGTSGSLFLLRTNGTTNISIGTSSGNPTIKAEAGKSLNFFTDSTQVANITPNGITFGADTAAANALDDYEEGTWTMGISFGGGTTGITYGGRTGQYTKVGRMVTVTGQMFLTNKGSSTGIVKITGLPFTIGSMGSFYPSAAVRYENITYGGMLQSFGDVNTTDLFLEQYSILGVGSILTDTNFVNNSSILLSFTYFV
jgi:hypothetical protein